MGNDAVDMVALATRVRWLARGQPRVFVGIDGPGGAGKSTFAEQLAEAMGDACLVHGDDFCFPTGRRRERAGEVGALFDLPRLAEQVVAPGAQGKALRYQRYDWTEDELTEWLEVPGGVPVILEGVFCLISELRRAYTFRIWCYADPMLRLSRGIARDGEVARPLWVDEWMPAEDEYVAREHPERSADLVVDSSPAEEHERVFRVVEERSR